MFAFCYTHAAATRPRPWGQGDSAQNSARNRNSVDKSCYSSEIMGMEPAEILEIIRREEDGKHQFKADIRNVDTLAAEMVAFSNSAGGQLLLGVQNNGQIAGLTRDDMRRLNQLVSNAASQSVRPPINPQTENIAFPDGLVMVVSIPEGLNKPYMDNQGAIWVKSGADKRKVTAREEMQRRFQQAHLLYGDEVPVPGMTAQDIDFDYFRRFFEQQYGEPLDPDVASLTTLLENMNLMAGGALNVAGVLLFGKRPEFRLPTCGVKAVAYPGDDIHVSTYRDSEDIGGKLEEVFKQALAFLTRHLWRVQNGRHVNSVGELEIPPVALEELLVNALIHRDYFISAPVRLFIFDHRIEIISPGHLPNHLTVEHIKRGISNIRNPILASFAAKMLPYRGLGNGIRRALKTYPAITFDDDREGNTFTVTLARRAMAMS